MGDKQHDGFVKMEGRKKMFYLTTHSTHFIYGYMASDIRLRTILIVRKETRCRHIGYSFRLTARVLLYAPSHRQDSTYHGLCYTSGGALAGTRNSSMGSPYEGSIRRPTAPWTNALIMELYLAPRKDETCLKTVLLDWKYINITSLTSGRNLHNCAYLSLLEIHDTYVYKSESSIFNAITETHVRLPMVMFPQSHLSYNWS